MNSTQQNLPAETIEPRNVSDIIPPQIIVSSSASHNPESGLNPIVDAAANLFTLIGKLKRLNTNPDLKKLQNDLVEEINKFYETVKNHGYSAEYTTVCRYIMCSILDEIISHSAIGRQGNWEKYNLLAAFNQDVNHQERFFTIMERIVKEPALYIDLMELMYLCLSLEYKGRYRTMEHGQYALEEVINGLYKHIRVYRGSYSKILSPTSMKLRSSITKRKPSIKTIFIVTACIILTILISLSYIMDVITNEPYKNTTQSGNEV